MDLTEQEKQVLLNIIGQSRFTPDEYEQFVRPIILKLKIQEPEKI